MTAAMDWYDVVVITVVAFLTLPVLVVKLWHDWKADHDPAFLAEVERNRRRAQWRKDHPEESGQGPD